MECPFTFVRGHVRDRRPRPEDDDGRPPRIPRIPPQIPPPPVPIIPPIFIPRGKRGVRPELAPVAPAVFHDVEALFGHPPPSEVREAVEELFRGKPTKPRKVDEQPEFEDPDDQDPPEKGLRTQEAPSQLLLAQLIGAGVAVAAKKVALGIPPFAGIPEEVSNGLRTGRAIAPVDSFSELHDFGASLVSVPQGLREALGEEAVTQEVGARFSDRLVPALIGAGGAVGGGLLFNAASRMNRLIGRQPAQSIQPTQPIDESQEL